MSVPREYHVWLLLGLVSLGVFEALRYFIPTCKQAWTLGFPEPRGSKFTFIRLAMLPLLLAALGCLLQAFRILLGYA